MKDFELYKFIFFSFIFVSFVLGLIYYKFKSNYKKTNK